MAGYTFILLLLLFCSTASRADVPHVDTPKEETPTRAEALDSASKKKHNSCVTGLKYLEPLAAADGGFNPLSDWQLDHIRDEDRSAYLGDLEKFLSCTEAEIAKLSTDQLFPWYQSLNRSISEEERSAAPSRHRIEFLKRVRSVFEEELYPPGMAALRREYREGADRFRELSKTRDLTSEEKKDYADLLYHQYLLLLVSPQELADLRKNRVTYPPADKRGAEFLKQRPGWVEKRIESLLAENKIKLTKEEFKSYFEPRVTFDRDGNAKLSFVPSLALQKKQAKQAIAITTYEKGNQDEGTQLARFVPLSLPKNADESLSALVRLRQENLFQIDERRLVDRRMVRGKGVEGTGDEIALLSLVASGGASAIGNSVTGAAKLSGSKLAAMAKTGALFGAGFDIADQAARNFDDWTKGKALSGYNPLTTLFNAGAGALLTPFAGSSKRLQNMMVLAGAGSTADHALNGDFGRAAVAGTGTFLLPKVVETVSRRSLFDALPSDPHLHVTKDPLTGKVIIDKEHSSWQAFLAKVDRFESNPDRYGKFIYNGDFIDAPSLKALAKSGVQVDMVRDRARLIAEVRDYVQGRTGKEVLIGLGNHDAATKGEIVSPTTGKTRTSYVGDEVAGELKKYGIDPYVVNDISSAEIPLPVVPGGRVGFVRTSHKVINNGKNIKEMFPPETLERIAADVEFMGNPQGSGNVFAAASSDTHYPLHIVVPRNGNIPWYQQALNLFRFGNRYEPFTYLNSGAVSPESAARLVPRGTDNQRTIGTFVEYQTDRFGRVYPQFVGIERNAAGKYVTMELDLKQFSAVFPEGFGDGIARPVYRNHMPSADVQYPLLLIRAMRVAPFFSQPTDDSDTSN